MRRLITNIEIHPITSEPFRGEVLTENGIIKRISRKIEEEYDEKVNGNYGHLYPSFIDAHSHVGVVKDGLGWEFAEANEMIQPVTADVRAEDGFATDDFSLKESVLGGVMISCVLPGSGNPVGGLGMIVKYSPSLLLDDIVIKRDVGLKMATGENPKRVYSSKNKMPVTRMATAAIIRKYLEDGQNYIQKKNKAAEKDEDFCEIDEKKEIAQKVLEKKMPVRIHCHRAEDILTALRIKKEFDINMSIEHCTEYVKVKDEVKSAGVPILMGPIMGTRPKTELGDMTYLAYKTACEEDMLFACISDHPIIPAESLRLQAGMAVNYGADESRMLESLTIMPAKILGINSEYGSIEEGKKDLLCLWNGHPFDSRSRVVWNSVDGFMK